MPYLTPTVDNFHHARWMRREIQLDARFDPFLERLAEEVRRHAGKADRQGVLANIKTALSVLEPFTF